MSKIKIIVAIILSVIATVLVIFRPAVGICIFPFVLGWIIKQFDE